MRLVVVESPAKAKTINKYLGSDYHVLASYGHVRDLPAKDGSVRPDADFAMDWSVDDRGDKRIKEIARALKSADQLYLATDPDREGEAISWHIVEELRRRKALKDVPIKRVVFNEITKKAIVDAFQHPRELNRELVDAYLARRALDYLVGFTLSPVLWRKLPGSRSAGRVQSVALRLVCEREAEIEAFRPQEYWSVAARLDGVETAAFPSRLVQLGEQKIERLTLGDRGSADRAKAVIEQGRRFRVSRVERRQTKRPPAPPFPTSTLQQEASRKLGFGATRTMRIAQKLYEGVELGGETVGLITYMRTDGVAMGGEAIAAARGVIASRFGDRYLPGAPRQYKVKAKNAQEAHEPIRPTDFSRRPDEARRSLSEEEARLYELIYTRALASQMESAELDQVSVDIGVDDGKAVLRATGSTVTFDGFLRLYQEGRDDSDEADEANARLPRLTEGQDLNLLEVTAEQHFTQPPPRYSEASLVKRLEELGIGRPSTYASILQVLQDRDYVRLDKRRFVPEDRGRVVTAFLTAFFKRYVEYGFTAALEEELDDVSGGRVDWKTLLRRFWEAFSAAVEGTSDLRVAEVIDTLDRELGPHFFPVDPDKPRDNPRACPSCGDGRLGLRLGRSGGFIGCSNYPNCRYTRPLAVAGADGDATTPEAGGERVLGTDPETGLPVSLRKGPYGLYLQLGGGSGEEKPKRASLPKGLDPAGLDLDRALALLSLPRRLGDHEGEEVSAGIGRFGPYVRKGSLYKSLGAGEDVLSIGLNRAVDLLVEAAEKAAANTRQLGEHPAGGAVTLHRGRYGPYVKHGKLLANLPKSADFDAVTLQEAVDLLGRQAEKAPAAKGGRKAGKAAADKKPAGGKTATAKKAPAARKAAAPKKPAKTAARTAGTKRAAKASADEGGEAKPAKRARSA